MAIKYHVRLTEEERIRLDSLVKQEKPRVAQYKKRNAQILLAIDENKNPLTHEQASKAFRVKSVTITCLRQRLVEEGLEVAVHGKRSHHGSKPILDGDGQAHLISIACSPPPEGCTRWTLNLIRDCMIELEYVDSISRSTVHKELIKTKLNLGAKKSGASLLKKVRNL